jgi:hypothetical protein
MLHELAEWAAVIGGFATVGMFFLAALDRRKRPKD